MQLLRRVLQDKHSIFLTYKPQITGEPAASCALNNLRCVALNVFYSSVLFVEFFIGHTEACSGFLSLLLGIIWYMAKILFSTMRAPEDTFTVYMYWKHAFPPFGMKCMSAWRASILFLWDYLPGDIENHGWENNNRNSYYPPWHIVGGTAEMHLAWTKRYTHKEQCCKTNYFFHCVLLC